MFSKQQFKEEKEHILLWFCRTVIYKTIQQYQTDTYCVISVILYSLLQQYLH